MRQFVVFRFESLGVMRNVYSTMRSAGIRPYKLYVQFQERKKKEMKSLITLFFTTVILVSNANAGIIFETGTGPFDSTVCCGSSIAKDQFIGTTFSLTGKTKIDAIGGH